MAKHGKKYRKAAVAEKPWQDLPVDEALQKLKIFLMLNLMNQSMFISILGIDASKGEQTVRGSVVLPHSKVKQLKLIVFAKGEYADAAKKAGADFVGG